MNVEENKEERLLNLAQKRDPKDYDEVTSLLSELLEKSTEGEVVNWEAIEMAQAYTREVSSNSS